MQIEEEVGYLPSQVSLVRSGRPLYVDDADLHFAVHAFLFSLNSSAAEVPPRLNWENIDAQFVKADAVARLPTVPLLLETLERVMLTPSQATLLAAIAADREHGAAEVALWVLDALQGAHFSKTFPACSLLNWL